MRRYRDHGQLGEAAILADLLDNGEPTGSGHLNVHQHQIGDEFLDFIQGVGAVAGFNNVVALGLKNLADQLPARRIIFRHNNRLRRLLWLHGQPTDEALQT